MRLPPEADRYSTVSASLGQPVDQAVALGVAVHPGDVVDEEPVHIDQLPVRFRMGRSRPMLHRWVLLPHGGAVAGFDGVSEHHRE